MVDFPSYLYKGDNFCDFLFDFLKMESTVKGKNLLPEGANSFLSGSKFFPFTVDPFLEGGQNNSDGADLFCLTLTKV